MCARSNGTRKIARAGILTIKITIKELIIKACIPKTLFPLTIILGQNCKSRNAKLDGLCHKSNQSASTYIASFCEYRKWI